MLSSMLKQHQEQMKSRNETQEKLKKDTVDAANELTQNLVIFIDNFISKYYASRNKILLIIKMSLTRCSMNETIFSRSRI
jgi:hypothetical protein